jgi:YebC/PmpR family DNA-binding regulatory protein
MPKDNIERAILRGAGELPGQQLEEITYEGYGPGGVALLLRCVTDNTNRTSANLRTILSKGGGKLGGSGTVSYLFKQRGVLRVADASEAMQLKAMDAGVEDVTEEDDGLTMYTTPQQFDRVKTHLGSDVAYAQVDMVPDTTIALSSDDAATFERLLTTLEDDDDVVTIYHNAK